MIIQNKCSYKHMCTFKYNQAAINHHDNNVNKIYHLPAHCNSKYTPMKKLSHYYTGARTSSELCRACLQGLYTKYSLYFWIVTVSTHALYYILYYIQALRLLCLVLLRSKLAFTSSATVQSPCLLRKKRFWTSASIDVSQIV